MNDKPRIVSVHAPDTGTGDGLIADSAVFTELECRAAGVVTTLLPPEPLALDLVARQIERASESGPVAGIRVGSVHGAPQAELVAAFLRRMAPETSVVAVAMRAGEQSLIDAPTQQALEDALYPAARVIVVRAVDAAALTGAPLDDPAGSRDAASALRARGARAVIVAGLFTRGRVIDVVDDAGALRLLDTARIQAPHVPGLAGAYAAALTAHLARGAGLGDAAEAAQRYVGFRIQRGR